MLILALIHIPGFLQSTAHSEQSEDILKAEIENWNEEVLAQMKQEATTYSEEFKKQLEQLKQRKVYGCTNGIMPQQLTPPQYLKYFAKGPCSPAVVLPGIMGSKLVASINCNALKNGDPYTFKKCGWTSCGMFGKKPNAEYQIWIPRILSPASLVKPYGNSKSCFTGLFGFKMTGTGTRMKLNPVPGVKISTLGMTPNLGKKKSDFKCGWDAIEDFIPLKHLKIPGTLVFNTMRELFIRAGYKIGVTLQALPYDFRLDTRENLLNRKFKRVVDEMYEMVGKRVTLISHSFGNFQVLNYLWSLPQQEKDQKISKYIALAPPLAGAVKPVISMIGMDKSFSKQLLIAKVGLTQEFFTRSIFMFKGMYNLFPGNHFQLHKDLPYMKAIMSRINAENRKTDPPKGTVMDIFPSFRSECVVGFKDRIDNCALFLNDMTQFGTIMGKPITYSNLFTMMARYSFSEHTADVMKASRDERFNQFQNPGVQTNIVYSTAVPTLAKIHYNSNPRTKTNNGRIYNPDREENKNGDGSVLSTSALIPGIKWADEFMFKRDPNAKPVTFVEVCSKQNQKTSIFQDGNKVVKNEYIGVDCSCKGNKSKRADGSKCGGHATLVEEPKVMSFVLNSLMDGETGKVGARFASMSISRLRAYEGNCELYTKN